MRYIKPSVSNGKVEEQALIRRWWHERHQAHGILVWEYYLEPCFIDAVWFPHEPGTGIEKTGQMAPRRYPIHGNRIVLLEAKKTLRSDLLGQALTHGWLAKRSGAIVESSVVLAEVGHPSFIQFGKELGFEVVVKPLE